MYFFFIATLRLNILKYIHTKIIYVRSSCNYIISEFGIIEVFIISVDKSGFSFWNPILNSGTVKRWKSERPLSKVLLCWNILGRFVSIRSIHVGLSGFLKYVGTFIKLFRQFMSQTFFIEFLSISTLKFYCTSNLKTTFFFSNWSQQKDFLYCIVIYIAINVMECPP